MGATKTTIASPTGRDRCPGDIVIYTLARATSLRIISDTENAGSSLTVPPSMMRHDGAGQTFAVAPVRYHFLSRLDLRIHFIPCIVCPSLTLFHG